MFQLSIQHFEASIESVTRLYPLARLREHQPGLPQASLLTFFGRSQRRAVHTGATAVVEVNMDGIHSPHHSQLNYTIWFSI